MIQVLFVCLGNICRSPSAEAVFKASIRKYGLDNEISCDSSGTSVYHEGESADYRMKRFASLRGYQLTGISRKVLPETDFDRFDYIIGMDTQNVRNLKSIARNDDDRQKICLITDFCINGRHHSVPDPYYGGASGFELVLDILEDACEGLIRKLQKK